MELNKMIDHTVLKNTTQKADIVKLCEEAKEHNFASVCVNTCWVSLCAELLAGTDVKVCTVVGFPLGAMDTASKAFETKTAIANGAGEIDMVINIGKLKDGEVEYVTNDIAAVVEAAQGRCVKVIIETCDLTDEEKVVACKASVDAKATFVKTSTGFSTGGATVADVALMKANITPEMEVKASGGVRNIEDCQKMIDAGATRIGTSNGIAIIEGATVTEGY